MRDGLLVVDSHAHIQLVHHRVGGRDTTHSTEQLLGRMNTFGIDAALVIAHAWAGWTLDQYTAEHDRVAEAISHHPARLWGACWADPMLGDAAVSEVRRCIQELGYLALKLHPVYQRFAFDGSEVRPLIDLCAELKIPVVAHLDLRVPGAEPWRMIRLAEHYPSVQFVMAHMGRDLRALSDLSYARAAADVENVYLEGSSTGTDSFGTFAGPAEILGSRRVLFATDSGALHHPAVNLLKVDLIDIRRAAKADILGLNACRLFGIDMEMIERTADHQRGHYQTALGNQTYSFPAPLMQTLDRETS